MGDSEEDGCQIETGEMGVDIAVEIVDITVRIVKCGTDDV